MREGDVKMGIADVARLHLTNHQRNRLAKILRSVSTAEQAHVLATAIETVEPEAIPEKPEHSFGMVRNAQVERRIDAALTSALEGGYEMFDELFVFIESALLRDVHGLRMRTAGLLATLHKIETSAVVADALRGLLFPDREEQ